MSIYYPVIPTNSSVTDYTCTSGSVEVFIGFNSHKHHTCSLLPIAVGPHSLIFINLLMECVDCIQPEDHRSQNQPKRNYSQVLLLGSDATPILATHFSPIELTHSFFILPLQSFMERLQRGEVCGQLAGPYMAKIPCVIHGSNQAAVFHCHCGYTVTLRYL